MTSTPLGADGSIQGTGATGIQPPPASKPAPALQPKQPGHWRMMLDLGWMIGVAYRAAPMPCSFVGIIAVIQGLIVPLQLWLTKSLVDALAAQLKGGAAEATFLWLGLLVASLLFDRTLTGLQPWMESSVRERTGSSLQERVMWKASRLDLASFEYQGYYDELSKVLSEVEARVPRLLQTAQQLVRTIPQLVGYAVAIFYLTPVLLAIVAIPAAASVVAWVASGQINYGLVSRQTRDRRLAAYYSDVLLDRRFAKEVRLYGLAGELLDRWSKLYWKARIERRRLLLKMNLRLRSANGVSTAIIMGGLLWVVLSGMLRTSAGGYALLFQSIEGLTSSLFGMGNVFQNLGEQSGYASAFRAFARIPVSNPLSSPARGGGEGRGGWRAGVGSPHWWRRHSCLRTQPPTIATSGSGRASGSRTSGSRIPVAAFRPSRARASVWARARSWHW